MADDEAPPEYRTGSDPRTLRDALGCFATGVTVVTTRHLAAPAGMTLNSFTSVSLDPPLVLVCVDKEARFRDAVLEAGTWAVSVLSADGRRAADWFVTKGRPAAQFEGIETLEGPTTGIPVIDGALAWVECRTEAVHDGGDHDIVVGAVVAVADGERDADALLYHRSRYGRTT